MTIEIKEAAVYVGTYAKYNSGSIEGKWLKFSDYSNAEEFMQACLELHSDEEDPELMFQDFENFPKELYSESMGTKDIEKIYEAIEILEKLENYDAGDWVNLHNNYCQNTELWDCEIHSFDEEFFETFFANKPMEAARAASFGKVNWSDEWIKFNGYGNLESLSNYDIEHEIDKKGIIQDITENPDNYDL